ncbi:hypothetical protein [Acaryochloris marina]|uniref:hypothetical protein n=1 Tax=Acaryochloris marina TaxID=155978 RepID=UPI0021C31D73|nr:hypothetical protein [Acaryochloris marina]BDM83511.1 hypothetical protein AM10699_63720 [Acaryochloris marina MBIC10699]
MPQSQVTEVDVVKESVRHNEKSIDALTADFKEFRKEVNGKFERVDEKLEAINTNINTKFDAINTKFEAINNRFITLYALIAFSILIPIGIEIFQATKH